MSRFILGIVEDGDQNDETDHQHQGPDADPSQNDPRSGQSTTFDPLWRAADFRFGDVAENKSENRTEPVNPQNAEDQAGDGHSARTASRLHRRDKRRFVCRRLSD